MISTLVLLTPFILFLWKFAPKGQKTWTTPFFTFESNYYEDVQVFLHQALTKLALLVICVIWFLTNRSWWRFSILGPIAIFLWQLISVINDDTQTYDEFTFLNSLSVSIPIMIVLVITSLKLNKLAPKLSTLDEIEKELKNTSQQ